MTANALSAPVSLRTAYTATPPSECLNRCESRQSDAVSKVLCEPGQNLCPRCVDRADTWLREIPTLYGLCLWVQDHGTVPSDPGTKRTKRPDPPAPMRLEVLDLLDQRTGRGVLGIVHPWADLVRDERCLWVPEKDTVAKACSLILRHLNYAAGRDWAGDLYDELASLHRTLQDTVGEYRAKPVGRCAAMPDEQLCDGPLVMDRDRVGVRCLRCGARHEANHELRQLGLLVDRIFTQEAS